LSIQLKKTLASHFWLFFGRKSASLGDIFPFSLVIYRRQFPAFTPFILYEN